MMALPHAAPGEKVNLNELASIRGASTSALVKTDRFEAAHLVLPAGSKIAPHAVNGHITLQCLEGAVALQADNNVALQEGDWVYLDPGEEHALSAIADSRLLLTILFD
jgi:quercetin dioxygenase-like cupin family protein